MSWLESLAIIVATVASVVAAVNAKQTVEESRKLREGTFAPELAIYLERNQRFRNSVDLVVSNIGTTPAFDIRFIGVEGQIPFGFFPGESAYVLRHGIAYFAPGQSFRFSLNEFNDIPKDEFKIQASYRSKGDPIGKRPLVETFTLRPLEHSGFSEWNDRQREAYVATTKAMKALLRGKILITIREAASRRDDREHEYQVTEAETNGYEESAGCE